ncbi:MAG: type II secretion system minor pseudopilin GspJ [Pseudomonadota bacterium]
MSRVSRGFSLIEILVAMAVFAILSVVAWSALNNAFISSEIVGDRMDRLQSLQQTMRFLSSDILQSAPRPIRDELGDSYKPAIMSVAGNEFPLELTHGGWTNPAGLPRATLQRSAYRIEDDQLVRYHWRVLDRTYANEPITQVLLDGVESLAFRFYDANGETSDSWPALAAGGGANPRSRPRAVEIILTLTGEGEITRLVEVAP